MRRGHLWLRLHGTTNSPQTIFKALIAQAFIDNYDIEPIIMKTTNDRQASITTSKAQITLYPSIKLSEEYFGAELLSIVKANANR